MSTAYRHTLAPVLGVMVAGHRHGRLSRYTGAHGNEAPEDGALARTLSRILSSLRAEATEAFRRGQPVYDDQPAECRLLTGVANGADELAANLAKPCGYDLHILGPGRAADADYQTPEPDRAVSLGMKPTGRKAVALRQSDYSLRDNLALSFCDVLVALWDGREPFPMSSGTALAVKSALLRRTPVIWLDISQTEEPPRIRMTEMHRLTDSALTELDVLGATPDMMGSLFADADPDDIDVRIRRWFETLLVPFEPALSADNAEQRLRRRVNRQPGLSRYIVDWLKYGASALSGRTVERPVGPVSWLRGGALWFRIMLNPPRHSSALRILQCLNSPVRHFSWQENLVSRWHGFFSHLIKLSPKTAWQSLRQTHLTHHPDDARSDDPNKPTVETSLPDFFFWADAQARVFSIRHRDDTWVIYYAAALAVFCAVAGSIYLWPANQSGLGLTWVILEFLLLRFVVGQVLIARFKGWHGRWMSYRYLAEQLRMIRLGFPLLVLPRSTRSAVWQPVPPSDQPDEPHARGIQITQPEDWILQRILVAEGLPQSARGKAWFRITHHNDAILTGINRKLAANQRYFQRVYHQLHRDHHYLHRFSLVLFGLTFLAVLSHFLFTLPGMLFFTAFFPAWGAAIHGILTQNEVAHISYMASQTWQRLTTLSTAMRYHHTITDTGIALNDQALAWARTQELRDLVKAVITALEDDNRQWVSLLQHNEPELPA